MPITQPPVDAVIQALTAAVRPCDVSVFRGQTRVVVPVERALDAFRHLAGAGFDLLVDVTCVDYLDYRGAKQRYGLVYVLVNTVTNERLTVRVFADDPDPTVPSVTSIWRAADWLEREVWDLFGVRFEGHPDLRRLVMPEVFTAHPLRKDYPLQGRGERHNFPVLTRDDG
ncbi:MAG: NADH-quinone oxidoreductase subunit C [Planctomycetia bacterium]|nr:NADH-quinone oxidoreductase subunit C [Planctomycetia bacterium]